MPDLNRATMRQTLNGITADGGRNMQRTVTAAALAGEKQAKRNATNGSHAKGTPTPAHKGNGPARISGNLLRNITHDRTRRTGTVYTSAVGVASGAIYGKYVEGIGYVFMKPVAAFLRTVVVPQVARSEFAKWRRR